MTAVTFTLPPFRRSRFATGRRSLSFLLSWVPGFMNSGLVLNAARLPNVPCRATRHTGAVVGHATTAVAVRRFFASLTLLTAAEGRRYARPQRARDRARRPGGPGGAAVHCQRSDPKKVSSA